MLEEEFSSRRAHVDDQCIVFQGDELHAVGNRGIVYRADIDVHTGEVGIQGRGVARKSGIIGFVGKVVHESKGSVANGTYLTNI